MQSKRGKVPKRKCYAELSHMHRAWLEANTRPILCQSDNYFSGCQPQLRHWRQSFIAQAIPHQNRPRPSLPFTSRLGREAGERQQGSRRVCVLVLPLHSRRPILLVINTRCRVEQVPANTQGLCSHDSQSEPGLEPRSSNCPRLPSY